MAAPPADPIADLSHLPASDMKKLGWRGVMRAVLSEGTVLVTNHAQPEAVIVSLAEYRHLIESAHAAAAKMESEMDALRQRFDKRLAALRTPDAGGRLRTVMDRPAKLHAKVKAGTGY